MDLFEIDRAVEAFIEQLVLRDSAWNHDVSLKLRELVKEDFGQVEFAFTGPDAESNEIVLVFADWTLGTYMTFDGRRLRKARATFPSYELVEEIDLKSGQRFGRMEGTWTVDLYGYERWDAARRAAFKRSWQTMAEGVTGMGV